jgi:hypothetical protein
VLALLAACGTVGSNPVDTVDATTPQGEDAAPSADAALPPPMTWLLATGNARSDRTDPQAPVAKEPIVVYAPDGAGYRAIWTSTELDWTRDVAWGDYDGDGALDFAVGNGYGRQRRNRVYRNTGAAWELAWTAPSAQWTQAIAWLDADADGKLDLIAGVSGAVMLYANAGAAGFTERELVSTRDAEGASDVCSVAVADYDRDGDLDLAIGTSEGPRVYRNASGVFSSLWSAPATGCGPVTWADYDRDGDDDVTVAGLLGGVHDVQIYAYQGGEFAKAWSLRTEVRGVENVTTEDLAWLDYDGDGDLDLATASADAPPGGGTVVAGAQRVYRNSGGSFAVGWMSPSTMLAGSVSAADYDGDGDADLAYGVDGPDVVLENLGTSFAEAWTSGTADLTTAIRWAGVPR